MSKCKKCSGNCSCSSNCKAGNVVLPKGPKGDAPVITIVDGFLYVDGVNTGQNLTGDTGVGIVNIIDNGNGTWTVNYTDGSTQIINAPAFTVSMQNTGSGLEVYNSGSGATKLFRTVVPKGFKYGLQTTDEIEILKQDHQYHQIEILPNYPAFHYYAGNTVNGNIINSEINGKEPSAPIMMEGSFIYMKPFGLKHHWLSYNIDVVYSIPEAEGLADAQPVVSISFGLKGVGNEVSSSGIYYQTSQANTDPLLSGNQITSQGSNNLDTLDAAKIQQILTNPILQNDIQTQIYELHGNVQAPSYNKTANKFGHYISNSSQVCKVLFGSPQNEDEYNLTGYTAPALSADNILVFGFIPAFAGITMRFVCRGSMFVTNEYEYL